MYCGVVWDGGPDRDCVGGLVSQVASLPVLQQDEIDARRVIAQRGLERCYVLEPPL